MRKTAPDKRVTTRASQQVQGWRWMILQQNTGYLHSLTGLKVGIEAYKRHGPALRQDCSIIRPERCPHGNEQVPSPDCVCGIYYFDAYAHLLSYWRRECFPHFRPDVAPETAVTTGIATGPHLPDYMYPNSPGAWRGSQYKITAIAVQKSISPRTVDLLEQHYGVPVTRGIRPF